MDSGYWLRGSSGQWAVCLKLLDLTCTSGPEPVPWDLLDTVPLHVSGSCLASFLQTALVSSQTSLQSHLWKKCNHKFYALPAIPHVQSMTCLLFYYFFAQIKKYTTVLG